MNRYTRTIHPASNEGAFPIEVDVYCVLTAFGVTDPAIQHAVKKLLCAGGRGTKSVHQDLVEARQAVDRAIVIAEQSPAYIGEKVLKAMRSDADLEAATKPPEMQKPPAGKRTVSPEVFAQAKARLSPKQAKFVGDEATRMKAQAKAERKAAYQKKYRERKKAQRAKK